jgi:hypothetical protein
MGYISDWFLNLINSHKRVFPPQKDTRCEGGGRGGSEGSEIIKSKGGMNRDGIFKLLRSQGIDSASLSNLGGRYDNPIPIQFLAPIDCSKIPVLGG